MVAVNGPRRQGEQDGCPHATINNNLEGDCDSTSLCENPVEDDSAISSASLNYLNSQCPLILTRIVMIVMIVESKIEKFDCKSTLLQYMFAGTKFCRWSVKAKFIANFAGFAFAGFKIKHQ